ncbi:hypothetical protein EDC94DRAFT_268230 [Helicostylum pulchrum]|nr:hypothetical protein EDC94DRAFT_268230 [Helicostylum pulchrum]
MFSDNKPPEIKLVDEFPSFNSVVTVPNCWYYLSMLERFVDITSSMPQDILKMYLVRAEYRYFKWMYKTKKHRSVKHSIPPIDVAFFWQAHLLSPVRYQEDIMRMEPFNTARVPLKEIHEAQGNLKKSVIREWDSVMKDEPYDLTIDELIKKGSCASITCIVCNSRIRSPWGEYAKWRTDHTTALQCCCCYTSFTVKHVGKSNLNQDNASSVNSISGLMINSSGCPYKPAFIKQSLRPGTDIMSLPFDQGLQPLDEYLEKKEDSVFNSISPASRRSKYLIRTFFFNTHTILYVETIDAIQSTYLCTPYRGSSIDLIQAVARQYKFAVKVTKEINWDAPLGIIRGIRQYTNFLAVIKENKYLTAVPTYEIDLAWHAHMLHHRNYHTTCVKLIGKMINHDDTIPEDDLASYVKITDMAWEDRNKRLKAARKPPPLPSHGITSIEEENKENKEIKKTGFINKIKSLVSKTDGSGAEPRNRPIPKKQISNESFISGIKYIKGSYKCPPQYTHNLETSVVEINKNSGYEAEKASFHDKGAIREFIDLNNSDEIMDATFSNVKNSVYGFIG